MKIAISGKAGSGKSALAKFFIEEHNLKHISFAKKVKEIAMDLFGLSYDEAFGANKNREVLQGIGQKMREIDHDVWVKYLARQNDDNVVLDDLRYKNEYQLLKDNGFIMVRVLAPQELRQQRIPNTFPENTEHISEIDLDDIPFEEWDVTINNVSDIEYLRKCSNKIIESFKKVDDNV